MSRLSDAVREMLGLDLGDSQEQAFARYAAELAEWNQRFNLTAITEPEEVTVKHFLDSLSCLQVLPPDPGPLIDVGSGPGFPGLPLKILRPELALTLVESTGKKADFLRHVVQVLGLQGVQVVNLRAEEAGQLAEHRESYDWALARAVAPLPVLAEYLLPLVRVGGRMLALKGPDVRADMEMALPAVEALGGGLAELHRVRVPGLDQERYLVEIKKIEPTPAKYPRRPGMPGKRPLE